MQTQHRFFDDLSRLVSGTLGVASGACADLRLFARSRVETTLSRMDLVSREEFEAVKAVASEARLQNEALSRRLESLEGGVKPGAYEDGAAAEEERTTP